MTASSRGPRWLDELVYRLRGFSRWRRLPARYRRRQLLLGNLIAFLVSLFLAIALRGRAVELFGLVTVVLMVHLVIANEVGRRIRRQAEARRGRDSRKEAAHKAEQEAILHLQPAATRDALARAMRATPQSGNHLGGHGGGSTAESIAVEMAAELRRANLAMDNRPPVSERVKDLIDQSERQAVEQKLRPGAATDDDRKSMADNWRNNNKRSAGNG